MNTINNNDQQKKIELSFKLNNVRFFPEDIIEGKITIKSNPEKQDNKTFENTNISFSLIQTIYYKVEEFNFAKNQIETKMDNKSYIIDQKIINYEYLKGYSIEIGLQIPFQVQFAPKGDKLKQFYPSFRFISPKINCFIFHELAIEIPVDSNKYAQNIFIKKISKENAEDNNNKDDLDLQIFKEEMIKKLKIFNIGKLSYFVKTKKSVQYNDDLLPIEIHIDENDLTIRLKKINISLIKRLNVKKCMRFYYEKLTEKKISLLNNKKNNIIKENIQLNKDEFEDLPLEEIQKNIKDIIKEIDTLEDDTNLINNKMKFNFTPPLETEFFTFSYMIQIQFDLDSNLVEDKKCLIPIDYYDGAYINLNVINKNNNDNLIGNTIDNINNNININNEINKNVINNIEINKNENNKDEINKNEINKNEINIPDDIYNGFTVFDKDDFLDTIDGKKKFG